MLDTKGYKHTLRLCNTSSFGTAAMFSRMLLNVKLNIHCLSRFLQLLSETSFVPINISEICEIRTGKHDIMQRPVVLSTLGKIIPLY